MNVYRGSRLVLRGLRHPVLSVQQRNLRENENFTFDWTRVPDTLEKEREKYEKYSEIIGDGKFPSDNLNVRKVEYVASQDPAEWEHVQRLIDLCSPRLIPGIQLRYDLNTDMLIFMK